MKSSIKIDFADLDRGKGIEPVIMVRIDTTDDVRYSDPRDSLLKMLFQGAGDRLVIDYVNQESVADAHGQPSLISTIRLYRDEERINKMAIPVDVDGRFFGYTEGEYKVLLSSGEVQFFEIHKYVQHKDGDYRPLITWGNRLDGPDYTESLELKKRIDSMGLTDSEILDPEFFGKYRVEKV